MLDPSLPPTLRTNPSLGPLLPVRLPRRPARLHAPLLQPLPIALTGRRQRIQQPVLDGALASSAFRPAQPLARADHVGHVLDIGHVFGRVQGDGDAALAARAARAPDAVHVCGGRVRHVVVDDAVEPAESRPARQQVRRDEHPDFAASEPRHDAVARRRRQVGVQDRDARAAARFGWDVVEELGVAGPWRGEWFV